MIPGVDVFAGYGPVDWSAVRAAGYRFAIVKCTEGNEPRRNDTRFDANIRDAQLAGLYVAAYHFPYPLPSGPGLPSGRSPREQAERFYEVSHGCGTRPGELPPVVDAEWPEVGDWGKWGVTPASLSAWLREHCEAVAELWGRRPILYTYPFWWRVVSASADVAWAADYPLWIANYTHQTEGPPPASASPIIPTPWTSWTLWQHAAKGSLVRVPGIAACPVDRDVFAGDLDDLRRLANIDPNAITKPEGPDWAIVHAMPDMVDDGSDDDEPPEAA